jgi:phosphoserine aminotransferase
MGGIYVPWHLGDVWFASAQKCLAIPAGLAVLVCGPRAIAKAHEIGAKHYNSIPVLAKYAANNQTSYTPNVLSIYILGQHLMRTAPVRESEASLFARAAKYYAFANEHPLLTPLVKRKANQSPTVVAFEAAPDTLSRMKAAALAQGLMLGNGYIPWKDSTFRIANFPAYSDEDQNRVLGVLRNVN